jgi:glycosyltransferase involved in cell wall biosynthesis
MNNRLSMNHHPDQKQYKQASITSTNFQAKNFLEDIDSAIMTSQRVVKPRVLLAISVQLSDTMRADIVENKQPRRDYLALQEMLDADILYLSDTQKTRVARLIKRLFGPSTALAWAAFCRRRHYDVIFTDTEIVSLPLAILLKLRWTKPGHPRHVALAHYLSPFKKRIFFRFGAGSHIDTLIVHSSAQRVVATDTLHMPDKRVLRLPYQVDTHFWHPLAPSNIDTKDINTAQDRPIICVPGLEHRDYPTLLAAVRDLNVSVYISTRAVTPQQAALEKSPEWPKNTSFKMYNYGMLRQLYANASFVVVPLLEVDFQAGITVILEAMAMGKAVIVSGIRGQTDVVRDPRNNGRGSSLRAWWPGFLDDSDVTETLGKLSTGFYVTPGNADELRSIIQHLLDHPEVADELGRNGRRVVEAYFSIEAFVQRFATAIVGNQKKETL